MADLDELLKARETDKDEPGEIVVPLFTEEVSVSKRVVDKGGVQVSRTTREREELINELLAYERVEVERTPIGKPVDGMPQIREEGDTIVVPVVEEVLVLERRLVLKEEVRIRRVHRTERHEERVTLRRHEVTIERLPAEEHLAEEAAAGAAESSK